ncbi:MAG TPA: GAF domain-containing protein [Xanthomonadales bacterium]|nr:GAF domain-containing protein [Xanthomonadales bacterium]
MSQAVVSVSVPADAIVRDAVACAERLRAAGAPRESALRALVDAAERIAGDDVVASILVLDEDGLLRNGASPKLPADYLAAIDRLRPDPCVGTCAAAAATGNVVLTPDFRADGKWAELRHLPMALGFVGAWSMPIKAPDGTVLGTFGTYLRANRLPTPAEQEAVSQLAAQAARVLLAPSH